MAKRKQPPPILTLGGLTQADIDALKAKAIYAQDTPEERKVVKGRPTSYSKSRAETILEALKIGNPIGIAAQAGGVSKSTVLAWVERGDKLLETLRTAEDPESYNPPDPQEWDFLDFSYRYRAARTEFAQDLNDVVTSAAVANPDLALRFLKIHHPDEYRERTELNTTLKGDSEAPLQIGVTHEIKTTDEQIDWLAQLLATMADAGRLDDTDTANG